VSTDHWNAVGVSEQGLSFVVNTQVIQDAQNDQCMVLIGCIQHTTQPLHHPSVNINTVLQLLRPRYYRGRGIVFDRFLCYVAAKATYIRLLHGKIGFLGFFSALAPYTRVGPI